MTVKDLMMILANMPEQASIDLYSEGIEHAAEVLCVWQGRDGVVYVAPDYEAVRSDYLKPPKVTAEYWEVRTVTSDRL